MMHGARGVWLSGGLVATILLLLCWSAVRASNEGAQGQPLQEALDHLQPRAVWTHFHELTRIPRASHNEQQVSAFIADYGRKAGLETQVDAAGNVLIRKRASARGNRWPTVVLQAHMDMVVQPAPDAPPDAATRPVNAFVRDGWVHADRTSLGADGGIGVAIIMAVLDASDIDHGPLEALFTVGEEDGFVGIKALQPGLLKGRIYINVDNVQEGQLIISCAGATRVEALGKYVEQPVPDGMQALTVTIDGLRGGHSGLDIDKGRASANLLVARLVEGAPAPLGLRVARIDGGTKWNVITPRATAIVLVPAGSAKAFVDYVASFNRDVRKAYAGIDPDIAIATTPATMPARVMDLQDQQRLLRAVIEAPNGVHAMSSAVPGQVETSSNLGILTIGQGDFTAGAYVRSMVDDGMASSARRLEETFQRAGALVNVKKMYGSWPPNPASSLLGAMKRAYKASFGTLPAVGAVHAGLETAEVRNAYPDMDMVSMGPTISGEHTPEERLEIASVRKAYELLADTLKGLR